MRTIYIVFLYFLFDRTLPVILHSDVLNTVYVLLSKFFAVIVICELLTVVFKRGGIKLYPVLYILIVFLSLFVSTIINEGNIQKVVMLMYPIMAMCALFLLECQTMNRLINFIGAISTFYTSLALMNLFFLLFVPSLFSSQTFGGGEMYFLGGENLIGYPLLMGLFFTSLKWYLSNNSKSLVFYLSIYSITIFTIFSGSNVIGFLCALFLLVPNPLRKIVLSLSLNKLSLIFAVSFTVIIIFDNLMNILELPAITYIIEDVLGKNVTLTNRTIIWSIVLLGFFESPIFGHGIADTVDLFYISERWSEGYFSAHNQILQSLYEGGILLFLSFIPIIWWLSNALKQCDSPISNIFKATFCALLVMFMGEAAGLDKLLSLIVVTIPLVSVLKKPRSFENRKY